MPSAAPDSLPRRLRRVVTAATLHAVAWLCHYLGIARLFFWLNRGRKRIITYHNVLPDGPFAGALHAGVSHSAGVFRRQIDYLRRLFPCDTDLDNPRTLTLTFDDGYLNQYAVAHAILAEFGLRAYFFCTLALWEEDAPLRVDRLLCWLSHVPPGRYVLPLREGEAPIILAIAGDADRLPCWLRLNRLLAAREIDEAELLAAVEACVPLADIRAGLPADAYALRFTPIPAAALAAMRAYGHQVGAHARSHRSMALLDDADLHAEVAACAARVGDLFNTGVFSYPFGGVREVTPRVIDCVRAHGFTRAVANIALPLAGGMAYGPFFLPRFALPNTAARHELSFILSGAKYFLQHRRLLPRWA